jgi:hypothetical protein
VEDRRGGCRERGRGVRTLPSNKRGLVDDGGGESEGRVIFTTKRDCVGASCKVLHKQPGSYKNHMHIRMIASCKIRIKPKEHGY